MDEVEMIQHSQVPGISLFFSSVDYRTSHVHPELELLLVLDEPLIVSCGTRSCRVSPGQFVIFQSNQPHEVFREHRRCTLLCLQLSPTAFSPVYPTLNRVAFDDLLLWPHLSSQELQTLGQDLLDTMRVYLQQDEAYELLCVGKLSMLLHTLLTHLPKHTMSRGETRNRDKRSDRLSRLVEFVNQNYMHKIRLTDFAEIEHLSVNYLSGFVKEFLNQSFQDYVNTVRFNAARKQIASGSGNLIDVCMDCGFSDYRYFSRAFRTKLGMTPAQFQQLCPHDQEQPRLTQSASSVEHFFTREESLAMCDQYAQLFAPCTKQTV